MGWGHRAPHGECCPLGGRVVCPHHWLGKDHWEHHRACGPPGPRQRLYLLSQFSQSSFKRKLFEIKKKRRRIGKDERKKHAWRCHHRNPYVLSANPSRSSTGANTVVGIKPTLGLTSRAGVILISPRQETVRPICRTVLDAVFVLDEIVVLIKGTRKPQKQHPSSYLLGDTSNFSRQRLKFHFSSVFTSILVDNIEISNINVILNFKKALNAYLSELLVSPVKTLADVIAFNIKHSKEKLKEYGQDIFIPAESLNRSNSRPVKRAISNLKELSRNGIEKVMREKKLDAILAPAITPVYTILAIGGFAGITVLAGYDEEGVPFGICFGGLRGSEPKLIEIAHSF
ncbi:hypothetical protein AMTRI_Chr09g21000 [Amborella trichopoda]